MTWTPDQIADVEGHASTGQRRRSATAAQFHVVVPTDPCGGTTAAERYHPQTNPGGVRCSIVDAAINVFGPNPEATLVAAGAGGRPRLRRPSGRTTSACSTGSGRWRAGAITPAQFVDLNAKIGGIDIDTNPTAARITAPGSALPNAYRSGMINETNNLDRTAIIDCRGPDEGLFHDAYRAFAVRARLDREHGGHANQLIWEGPVTVHGRPRLRAKQLHRHGPLGSRRSHPTTGAFRSRARSSRTSPTTSATAATTAPATRSPTGSAPPASSTSTALRGRSRATRSPPTPTSAGCKPLERGDYGVQFTDAQWAELQATFPEGVCDFSKPGVGQQDTIAWQTYQRRNGDVIYGGRPLGPAPKSKAIKP